MVLFVGYRPLIVQYFMSVFGDCPCNWRRTIGLYLCKNAKGRTAVCWLNYTWGGGGGEYARRYCHYNKTFFLRPPLVGLVVVICRFPAKKTGVIVAQQHELLWLSRCEEKSTG